MNRYALIVMGDLSAMYVICEIFEIDLQRISRGMKATASRLIDENSQMGEVMIRLLDGTAVTGLINMQVDVSIQVSP